MGVVGDVVAGCLVNQGMVEMAKEAELASDTDVHDPVFKLQTGCPGGQQ